MKRWQKVLLGVVTHWPPLYMFLFVGFMIWMISHMGGSHQAPDAGPPTAFLVVMVLHISTILLMFALIAIYLIILFKSQDFPQDKRILWVLVILFFGIFSMPVFFWVHIWPRGENDQLFGARS